MIFKFFLHNNGFGDAGSAARSGRWNQIRYYHHRVEQKHSNKRVFWRGSLWLAGWLAGWLAMAGAAFNMAAPFSLLRASLSDIDRHLDRHLLVHVLINCSSLGLFSDAPSYRKPGRASTMGGGWV
jgi:hypothetical protein